MEGPSSNTRTARAARNQSLFREVNERLEVLARAFEEVAGPGTTFACECAKLDCFELVSMSVDEYEAIRGHPNHFAVLPGHVYPDVEVIVSETDRYLVVAKIGEGADVAALFDPRRVDREEPQRNSA